MSLKLDVIFKSPKTPSSASRILPKRSNCPGVIFPLCEIFANHAVLADEAENERLDAKTFQANFAV